MGHQPARLSRTLPKDFAFCPDGEPRTPERPTKELNAPPPPNHNSCRFRRPRLDILSTFEAKPMTFSSPDVPLPSIEEPEQSTEPHSTQPTHCPPADPQYDGHLQVPPREGLDLRTPPAQIRDITSREIQSSPNNEASHYGASVSRPSSACSNASNSSISSCDSYQSRPSLGGSCTSPESDIQDPFLTHPASCNKEVLDSPSKQPRTAGGTPFDLPTMRQWTSDMDNHLWDTYQTYLQDPMITPFKTVPGSIPPLGVSHRVAREARKTWPRTKRTSPFPTRAGKFQRRPLHRDITPVNRQSPANTRSGSTTPIAKTPLSKNLWPRSNASTRRRLKELCRRKFSMAPHYQRLLQSRSPSPFPDIATTSSGSSHPVPSSSNHATSFSRDLGVSLISTSIPTDIPGSAAEVNVIGNTCDNANTTNTAGLPVPTAGFAQSAPQSADDTFLENHSRVPRLGSPFMYHTWGPDRMHRRLYPSTPQNHPDTLHVTGVRLRSPIPEDMFLGGHKRRALNHLEDEVSPNGTSLDHGVPDLLCDGNKNIVQRRVRIRNRGVTTGALSSRERLHQLFTPPSQIGSSDSGNLGVPSASRNTTEPETQVNDIKRLGSPFCSRGKWSRHGSSRHAPSRSEPFVANNNPELYPRPLEQNSPLPLGRRESSALYNTMEDRLAGTEHRPPMDRRTTFD